MELIFTILLLIATYASGRWVEFRQFRSLERREQREHQIAILNTEEDGFLSSAVRTELISAHVVLAADYFRRFLGGLLSIFGGSLHTIESLSDRARREILLRLQEQVPLASYITGVRIEVLKEHPGMIQMLAMATAVYQDSPYDPKPRGYPQPLTHEGNAPKKHPLKELVYYGGITFLVLFLIMRGGSYIIDPLAQHISPDAEAWLWRNTGADFAEFDQQNLTEPLKLQERQLQALLDKLPKSDALAQQSFTLILVDDPAVNAVSVPGNRIVVFTGLLQELTSENALTFILAHELAHFENRDHVKQLVKLFFEQIIGWALGDANVCRVLPPLWAFLSHVSRKRWLI